MERGRRVLRKCRRRRDFGRGCNLRRFFIGPEPGGVATAAAAEDRRYRADWSVRDHPGEQGLASGHMQEGLAVSAEHRPRSPTRGAPKGMLDLIIFIKVVRLEEGVASGL